MKYLLPPGWRWLSPDEVSASEKHSLGIGPFGSDLKVSDYTDGGVPLVFVRNIRAEDFAIAGQPHVSVEKAAQLAAHRVAPSDVLITKMGEPPGDSAVYPERAPDGRMTADCIRLRVNPAVGTARFIMYATRAPAVRQQIIEATRGVAQKKISLERYRTVRYPVPPLDEQHRIVAAIETHFSRLDAAVASLTRAKANVKRARASVLKAAVEGRLVPTEAALARAEGREYEPAAVLVARVEQPPRPNRYKTRSSDVIPGHAALSVGDTKADLPEGWTRAPMVDIARMESGHTPSRNHPEWWDGDVPWIGIADARGHHGGVIYNTEQHTNADGLANSAARLLPKDTVCLSRTASVGYVVVMGRPMATSQDFVDWVCTEALDPHWLRIVFLADREALLRFGKGSVHKTIYFPEHLSLHIAIPPLAEQHRIIAEVDRRLSVLDALDTTLETNLARCARLRQSILKRAFEGRLVPAEPLPPRPGSAPLDHAQPQVSNAV